MSRAPEGSPATAPSEIVDLRQYRLLRLIDEAGKQQREVAQMMRDLETHRTQIADALKCAERHLAHAAEDYSTLMTRMNQERSFRDACQQAAELEDLDEMIRRRDALAEELARLRAAPRHLRQPETVE